MAAEEHAAQGLTAGEYIGHHLTHLQSQKQTWVIDFSVFNLDSIFWSVLLGVIGMFVMWRVARTVTAGVPGRMQAAVEILLEMVDTQAKGIIHNAESRKFVGPLALTVFVWVFLMNSMDFLPVDLIPMIWEAVYGAAGGDTHHAYMRVVPTADLSMTLGMSCAVNRFPNHWNQIDGQEVHGVHQEHPDKHRQGQGADKLARLRIVNNAFGL
jgi:F-type H+-transporting ATPase subunit a